MKYSICLGLIGALHALGVTGCAAHAGQPAAQPPTAANAPTREAVAPSAAPSSGAARQSITHSAVSCAAKPCMPDARVVAELCGGKNPDVALTMFAADSPWLRSYIRVREVDALNTLGGPSSEDKLVFDEEVLVLDGARPTKDQISVSGANGHHVLRLDGTCATVMDDELTTARPPAPRHARLVWNYLDASVQDALLSDAGVKAARRVQRVSCKGSWLLSGDAQCESARQRLGDAIFKAIERPVSLPEVSFNTPSHN
jgi:hypothetical protein